MIYKIETSSDPLIEEAYEKAMVELGKFYEMDWTKNRPKIAIVRDRQTIDELLGRKTEDYVVGFVGRVNNHAIFMLDKDKYETESCHKYNEEEYKTTVKHELSHLFYKVLIGNKDNYPIWLWEGVAVYTSEQNRFKTKPKKFTQFLDFYDKRGGAVYNEGGFAVGALVEKFDKAKLLELIKSLKTINSKPEFEAKFAEIYDIQPTYEEFNKLIY